MEKNQIRVLCIRCGCYYYWNIEFEFKDYRKAVWQTPKEAEVCCPECNSQEIAAQAHHSADFFNCQHTYSNRLPRYFSGPGSAQKPILVDNNKKKELENVRQKLMKINDQLDRMESERDGLDRVRDGLVLRYHALEEAIKEGG